MLVIVELNLCHHRLTYVSKNLKSEIENNKNVLFNQPKKSNTKIRNIVTTNTYENKKDYILQKTKPLILGTVIKENKFNCS